MTPDIIEANKQRFIALCHEHIKREGVDKVLAYLENTDFYTAPSSTNFHLNEDGGLCQHCINVFETACSIYDSVAQPAIENGTSPFQEQISREALPLPHCSTIYVKSKCTTKLNVGKKTTKANGSRTMDMK